MPDLLDRPADLGQHILLNRQTIFPEEPHHSSGDNVVEQGHALGVVGEVLPSQFRYLTLAQ
jgi:hypothetical protein